MMPGSQVAENRREPATARSSGVLLCVYCERIDVWHPPLRMTYTLETLPFDNLQLRSLPVHNNDNPAVPQSKVSGACFSRAQPTPLERPVLVASSASAMALLGIDSAELKREDFAAYFCGNKLLPGAEPAAHCYCGHQFGNFAGQLGDGATMYLGEVINPSGERWEIQFKGAGKTHYSRTADGRKARGTAQHSLAQPHGIASLA